MIEHTIRYIMAANPYTDDEFILNNLGDTEEGCPEWWAGLGGAGNPVALGEMGPGGATFNGYGDTPEAAVIALWHEVTKTEEAQ